MLAGNVRLVSGLFLFAEARHPVGCIIHCAPLTRVCRLRGIRGDLDVRMPCLTNKGRSLVSLLSGSSSDTEPMGKTVYLRAA